MRRFQTEVRLEDCGRIDFRHDSARCRAMRPLSFTCAASLTMRVPCVHSDACELPGPFGIIAERTIKQWHAVVHTQLRDRWIAALCRASRGRHDKGRDVANVKRRAVAARRPRVFV